MGSGPSRKPWVARRRAGEFGCRSMPGLQGPGNKGGVGRLGERAGLGSSRAWAGRPIVGIRRGTRRRRTISVDGWAVAHRRSASRLRRSTGGRPVRRHGTSTHEGSATASRGGWRSAALAWAGIMRLVAPISWRLADQRHLRARPCASAERRIGTSAPLVACAASAGLWRIPWGLKAIARFASPSRDAQAGIIRNREAA